MARKIEFPRIVLVGSGCIEQVKDITIELSSGKNMLVVAGDQTMQIAGNKVEQILKKERFNVFKSIAELADVNSVSAAQSIIKKENIDIVFGVGGGTAIDVAKLSSHKEGVPFISVPTAASHDGMGSPIAAIKENSSLHSQPATAPIAIIADTSIIKTAPSNMLASGCGDLLANYTAVEDWKLAHKLKNEYYGDYAAALSVMSAQVILDNYEFLKNQNEDAVKLVVEALISSGAAMCIAGNSRPSSGAEHLFSHALDKVCHEKTSLHGEQCGVGTIMMAYMHKMDWEKIRTALKTIGAPVNAKELGVPAEKIIEALTTAHKIRNRYTILGENGLSREAATELAKKTGVI